MLTFRKLKDTIVGTIDGKPFNLVRNEINEKFIADAIKNEASIEDVLGYVKSARSQEVAMSNKYIVFNPVTNQYYLAYDGYRSKHPIPETLVKYIEESYDKDIDFMPVVKAWTRLLDNPRYKSNDMMAEYFDTYINTTFLDQKEVDRLMEEEDMDQAAAEAIATYQDIAITQEGLLATYKVAEIITWEWMMQEQEDGTFKKVKNDKYKRIPAKICPDTGDELEPERFEKPIHLEEFVFTPAIIKNGDKFYSDKKLGYVYKVGQVQWLPKNAKRNLNNTSGGGGLYSGGLNYINCFRNEGTHVLTCFVDPADILSFQSEGHAFRTDALMPYNVWDEEATLQGKYHSSEYGKLSEERLDKLVKDAVAKGVDIAKEQEEINQGRSDGSLDLIEQPKDE